MAEKSAADKSRFKFILIVNAGSSSLKFKLFTDKLKEEASGVAEKIGQDNSFVSFYFHEQAAKQFVAMKNHTEALKTVFTVLEDRGIDLKSIVKVGHRVVHGGEKFIRPTLITPSALTELAKFNDLAPLHNPHNLAGIRACLKLLPKAKQYAAFDTAFHATIPDFAHRYALPEKYYIQYGIRRYGFHGLSHQYVGGEAARQLKIKNPYLIVCHLGSGCSITAIEKGKSVDTSMGFTPLEGLIMSTRTGDIDPSIIFYLKNQGLPLTQIEKLLNFESGFSGVSGFRDLRDIMLACGYKVNGYKASAPFSAEQKKASRLALRMFVYRIKKYIGAYAAILGRLDAVVFTGGIGERNADVRKLVMKGLPLKTRVMVVPTNEELMIGRLIK